MGINDLSRRDFIKKTAVVTVAASSGIGFPSIKNAYGKTKTKIGVVAPSHCALSMVHADISGNFKANGVDAEIVFKPDIKDIAKGIVKGELQAGQLISPVFFAVLHEAGSHCVFSSPADGQGEVAPGAALVFDGSTAGADA